MRWEGRGETKHHHPREGERSTHAMNRGSVPVWRGARLVKQILAHWALWPCDTREAVTSKKRRGQATRGKHKREGRRRGEEVRRGAKRRVQRQGETGEARNTCLLCLTFFKAKNIAKASQQQESQYDVLLERSEMG